MYGKVLLAFACALAAAAANQNTVHHNTRAAAPQPANGAANGQQPQQRRNAEPYLGSYAVQDGCQYSICGRDYSAQFGWGAQPQAGSCSGECDALARRVVDSQFKKEFLWSKCARMCQDKYPTDEYRTYQERLSCASECFTAFEKVTPHHQVAQSCLHMACTAGRRARTGMAEVECFEQCAHHVAVRVARDDWDEWAALLAAEECETDRPGVTANQLDHLACTDQALWGKLTANSQVSPDIHLLCLNALCDNDVRCAKQCLNHVTNIVERNDLPKWQQCTYSSGCRNIDAYGQRVRCADKCLDDHKRTLRQQEEQRRRESERRRKEAEALASATGGAAAIAGGAAAVAITVAAAML